MKKTFKRVVSVLAMLCLFATQFAAFAAENATTATEFVNGTEYEYNLYQLGTKYWYVNSNTSTLLSGTGVSKYAIAIYKLPLPELADDQKITNYKFTIPESHKAGQDIKADFRIVSLEGSTALWDSKLNASLTTKDEIIKKVLYDANAVNAWQAYDVCEGIVSNPPAEDDATKIYTYTIDISKYANDKYMQNDSDHFYVGVWTNWTAVMAWNQNMPDSSRPRAHFTVGEAESLAYTGANVTSGDMFVNKNTKPELYFNRKVSSATATLNGESVDCTVTKGFVKINANLEEGKTHTVAVAATDSTGAQVSAEISFSTYLGEMITQNPYSVSATGAKEWTYVESIATSAYFIYKLPFPKLDPGQKIGKYVFKYYSGRYGATYGRYMKIEQFDEDKIASVTTSHPDIAAVISKNDIPAGYAVQTAASQRATGFVYETINSTDYATIESEIDLTDYANQCYNECGGEKDYFLIGVNYRWTTRAYPVTLSAMTSRGFNTLYYATQVPADNLAIEEGSVADGDERTASSTALNFTYNNAVKAISATLNGEEVPCKIDGNHVTVDKALSQYTDYQLVLNATDIYNTPSLVSTINFKTGAYNEYKALNTDFEFSFIGPNGKVTDTSYHVKRGDSKTAVVKLKIPTVANDESLDRVVYTFYTNGASGVDVARLSGEKWDVSTLKYSDLSPYLSGSGFVSASNNSSHEDLGSSNYRVHRDITNYVKECRDKGQTYAFFALTTSSTIKAYAPTYSGKSYRPYYDYSVSKKEFNAALPKIVAADNSEAYANATALEALDKASSYKTVCSVTNIGNGTKDVVVAIAQYVDETVVNVEFTTVTVPENTSNFDVASKAITLSGEIGKAKAFVWSTEDNTPLASEVVASVN